MKRLGWLLVLLALCGALVDVDAQSRLRIRGLIGGTAAEVPPDPPDPPDPGEFCERPCFRLLLDEERLNTLIDRKNTPTAEYTAMVADITGRDSPGLESFLTSDLGTGGAGTTFTVSGGDVSSFPTSTNEYVIDYEIITATRSGNTLTIVTRGDDWPGSGLVTEVMAHPTGVSIWDLDHDALTGATGVNSNTFTQANCLRYALGETGSLKQGRYNMALLTASFATSITRDNEIRWLAYNMALGFDWCYEGLTARERSVYAALFQDIAEYHVTHMYPGGTAFAPGRDFYLNTSSTGENHVNGQMRSIMALAAAGAGEPEYPDYQEHWDQIIEWIDEFMLPSFNAMANYDGLTGEGVAYAHEDWHQWADILAVRQAAVGGTIIADTLDWMQRAATAMLQITRSGSTQGGSSALYTWGDSTGNAWDDRTFIEGAPQDAMAAWQSFYADVNPTLASHVEYWLDNVAAGPIGNNRWRLFVYHRPDITPVDYRSTIPLRWTTSGPDHLCFGVGRTSHSDANATQALFYGGYGTITHMQSQYGGWGLRRGGVWLSRWLAWYYTDGVQGTHEFADYPTTGDFGEIFGIGAAYHNVIWMNGHGPVSPRQDSSGYENSRLPTTCDRQEVGSNFVYMRADVSGWYRGASNNWTGIGYANNDAQTFKREWVYIPNDLVLLHDYTAYANATTSPTKWFMQTPCNPSRSGQRTTCTQSGQTLIHDVVLPASWSDVVETDQSILSSSIPAFRTEWTSGASASVEYGLQSAEAGDSGFTPASVALLTTTNANVVQKGNLAVVAFARGGGATPTLPITFTYTGTPSFKAFFGLATNTAYQLSDSSGTVTLSAGTGSGDVTSSANGVLTW